MAVADVVPKIEEEGDLLDKLLMDEIELAVGDTGEEILGDELLESVGLELGVTATVTDVDELGVEDTVLLPWGLEDDDG